MVMLRRIGAFNSAASRRDKKLLPNGDKPVNGLSDCEHNAAPGIILSCEPHRTVVNRSVVGSGPTRIPGKSLPNKYLTKDVFPTLYWPSNRIIGGASKSDGDKGGE